MNIINFWQAEFHNTIFIIFVSIQGSPQGLHEGGAREEGMGSYRGRSLVHAEILHFHWNAPSYGW